MSNHNTEVFEVVITHYDKETKTKAIIYGPKAILAQNEDAARLEAVRNIGMEFDSNELQVIARAF